MTMNYALFSGMCNSAIRPKFISGTEKHGVCNSYSYQPAFESGRISVRHVMGTKRNS